MDSYAAAAEETNLTNKNKKFGLCVLFVACVTHAVCTVARLPALSWGKTTTRAQMMKMLFGGGLLDGAGGKRPSAFSSSRSDATVKKKTTLPASAAAAIAASTALKSGASSSMTTVTTTTVTACTRDSDDPKMVSIEWDFDEAGGSPSPFPPPSPPPPPSQPLNLGGSGFSDGGRDFENLGVFCPEGQAVPGGAESLLSTEAVTPKARGGSGGGMWGEEGEAGAHAGTGGAGGSSAREPPPLVERQRRCLDGGKGGKV